MKTSVRISLWVLLVLLIGSGALLLGRRASAASGLAALNPNDAMAYRYTAMAQFYDRQASIASSASQGTKVLASIVPVQAQSFSGFPLPGVDLTTLSPVDAMAYRYQGLAYYYSTHPNATR